MRRLMQWFLALVMLLALWPGVGLAAGSTPAGAAHTDALQRIDPTAAQVADRGLETAQTGAQGAVAAGDTLLDDSMTFWDQTGRILTTPWVATLLLVVGIIGIGIEVMKPGVTFPGLLGITCLGLFFLGNILVGTASGLELVLAIVGIILIVLELFVPGGIVGTGGAILLAASIFLAAPTPERALMYLTWAALALLVVLFGLVRTIGKRGLGKFLTLEKSAQGWVPARSDLASLVGQEGTTLTVLRPAGTAQFGNLKVDVVTEGEFLPAGVSVRVVQVEGTRVVVRRTEPQA